ncbi:MAG: hypothetical protein HQL95_00500 [Magnetococcales bacterium]|nr:hypothetical protein [Magnetococcales bacterium]
MDHRFDDHTWFWDGYSERVKGGSSAKLAFQGLWDAINAKRGHGWDTNPWVWVIEFKRLEQ